jgi:hypothetical protein
MRNWHTSIDKTKTNPIVHNLGVRNNWIMQGKLLSYKQGTAILTIYTHQTDCFTNSCWMFVSNFKISFDSRLVFSISHVLRLCISIEL